MKKLTILLMFLLLVSCATTRKDVGDCLNDPVCTEQKAKKTTQSIVDAIISYINYGGGL